MNVLLSNIGSIFLFFLPEVISIGVLYNIYKFFGYSNKYRKSFKSRQKQKHNLQHFAIVLLFFVTILFFMPTHIFFKLSRLALTPGETMIITLIDFVFIVFLINISWVVEHFKDEEGGKFKY